LDQNSFPKKFLFEEIFTEEEVSLVLQTHRIARVVKVPDIIVIWVLRSPE
jgi:hypothetical protein